MQHKFIKLGVIETEIMGLGTLSIILSVEQFQAIHADQERSENTVQ
jgi:hypothetical protein